MPRLFILAIFNVYKLVEFYVKDRCGTIIRQQLGSLAAFLTADAEGQMERSTPTRNSFFLPFNSTARGPLQDLAQATYKLFFRSLLERRPVYERRRPGTNETIFTYHTETIGERHEK